jgi:uncharacterized membrane protein
MFYNLLIFVGSLILEAVIVFAVSPENPDGSVNHLFAILFALNTGLVFSSFYSLVLFFIYWVMKAYEDIKKRIFISRAMVFGLFVTICTLLKIYDLLDLTIGIALVIALIAVEAIMTFRRKQKEG